MLGLWEKPKSQIDLRHFAFECDPKWILEESVSWLEQRNLNYFNILREGSKQPMVFARMPAVSIYFDDPDGHSLEFTGILDGVGQTGLGVISYPEWLKSQENLR